MSSTSHISGTSQVSYMLLGLKLRLLEMSMFLHKQKLNAFFAVFHNNTAVTELNITDAFSLSLSLSLTHTHTHTHTHNTTSSEFSP